MKKIVDVIKLGESVGRKLSDNATETDKRRISDWDETASDKEEMLEKLSDPDYIQEKTLYYKSFDIAGAWKRAKVRELAQQKSIHSKMRKLIWGAAAAVTVLLSVTVYLFQQDDIVKENVEVHQAIANILPGRGVPVLYLDDNRQPIPEFFEMVDELEKRLEYDKKNTSLPEKPNYKEINEFVASVNERVVKGEV